MEKENRIITYNFETEKVKLFKSIDDLSKKLNETTNHLFEKINNEQLYKNTIGIYFLSKILENRKQPTFTISLPKRYIQRALAREKQKHTKIILDSLYYKVNERFKNIQILVFDDDLNIERILHGTQEASDYFKVPEGTIKSRLHRAKNKEFISKFKICKKSTFDKLKINLF